MGRSYMLLISSPSMSLVVALLMMFVSNVLSLIEVAPNSCATVYFATSDAEENVVKALYTGWGILSATGGDECSNPCACGWEGVMCKVGATCSSAWFLLCGNWWKDTGLSVRPLKPDNEASFNSAHLVGLTCSFCIGGKTLDCPSIP